MNIIYNAHFREEMGEKYDWLKDLLLALICSHDIVTDIEAIKSFVFYYGSEQLKKHFYTFKKYWN